MKITRRESLSILGAATAASWLDPLLRGAEESGKATPHVATNTYPWLTFARREGRPFNLHSDALLADIASAGIVGYEPIISNPAESDGLGERLQKHGLEMRSLYVNSLLHDEAKADESIASVIAIAKAAGSLGTTIIVTNPSPIRWGGPEDKNDAQLRTQAAALDRLGAELRILGLMLAYHNHDAELRQGGREFHHMLTATDPANVKFCLDAHWIFRGCGDSEVAVFDVLAHYHERVVELHLRQSKDGVWTETFTLSGDIDYIRLFDFLAEKQISPLCVLEQAVETKSPREMTVIEAHRQGRANLMKCLS
jgi:inosose dehydratase